MIRVTVIDYGSGNLRSVAKAFETVLTSPLRGEVARRAGGGEQPLQNTPSPALPPLGRGSVIITANPTDVKNATHIVLPGVGAFGDCVAGLNALPGMRDALENAVLGEKKPFLGICVGMQMLLETGHEHGSHKGLGWIGGEVVHLRDQGSGIRGQEDGTSTISLTPETRHLTPLKIPHMGWNELAPADHPLFSGIKAGDHAYFVHSYHAVCADSADVIATTEYGGPVTAALARGNIMGTQFHPEKSQGVGLRLLTNFLAL